MGEATSSGCFVDSSSLIHSLDSSMYLVCRRQWRQKKQIIHSLCVSKPLACNIDQRWEKLLPSSRVSLTPGRKRSQSHKSLRDISVVSFVVADLKGKQRDVWYTSHQRICTISGPDTALLKLILIEHACLLILPKGFPCEYLMLSAAIFPGFESTHCS